MSKAERFLDKMGNYLLTLDIASIIIIDNRDISSKGGEIMRKELIRARKARNLSVADMAERMNISASFYYKIESGDRNPTIDLAKRIADLLGGNVDILFFGSNLDDTSSKTIERAATLDTGTEG